jgi:hypothetical protein
VLEVPQFGVHGADHPRNLAKWAFSGVFVGAPGSSRPKIAVNSL